MAREIALTKGMVALVDDEDGYLDGQAWLAHLQMWKTYAARGQWNGTRVETILMHRVILGAGPSDHVDHINGDTLDNRRSNLRLCTRSQNAANAKVRTDGVSRFKGVSLDKRCPRKPWRATIVVNRRQRGLGYYATEQEAAAAYDAAAQAAFGEFAHGNGMLGAAQDEAGKATPGP